MKIDTNIKAKVNKAPWFLKNLNVSLEDSLDKDNDDEDFISKEKLILVPPIYFGEKTTDENSGVENKENSNYLNQSHFLANGEIELNKSTRNKLRDDIDEKNNKAIVGFTSKDQGNHVAVITWKV